jgi:hypothetical protein
MQGKLSAIALITILLSLPVQTLVCERIWAQEQSDRKTQSAQLLNQGLRQYRGGSMRKPFRLGKVP